MEDRIRELREMIEVVLIAIPREIQSYELYANSIRKATSPAAKRMFQYLAGQEKMHEAKLQAHLAELKAELELEKLKLKGS